MICTTYFLTFFSELIPPTGYINIYTIKCRGRVPHEPCLYKKQLKIELVDRLLLF